jgi:beta-glucosidase/6-phospho-beta-glucosidase/beta-galactosidase/ABC-type amino acid transport substrate-binding protein
MLYCTHSIRTVCSQYTIREGELIMDLRDVLSGLGGGRELPPLPEEFMFGVANSAHQSEAYDPAFEDVWDVWERQKGLTKRGQATDFWNRYEEDIGLARDLGCKAFRFSIAWSRVEPEPGQFNHEALDHYRRLVAAIRTAGMEPILTLHHFTWPTHVEVRGGMLADDFPDTFAAFTARVVEHLGEEVTWWVTFNEPSQLLYGYIKPWWESDYFIPPGLPDQAKLPDQVMAVGQLIRNLFLAHTRAREIIKSKFPDAMVGVNPLLLGLPVWLQRWINRNATRIRSQDDLVRQVHRCSERTMLERGEVDVVIATFTRTVERARRVMFSEVYFVAGQRLLIRAEGTVTGPGDLADQVVAVLKSSTAERDVGALVPGARVRVVEGPSAALEALDRGEADALLVDDTILRGLVAGHPGRYKLVGEPLSSEPYAAAVGLGSCELLAVIDVVVREFKESGAWENSLDRNLGEPGAGPPLGIIQAGPGPYEPGPAPGPTLAEMCERGFIYDILQRGGLPQGPLPPASPGSVLRRIQERGHLIVAVKEDVPGLGYRDPETGELSGLEIELARAIAERIFGDPDAVRFRPTNTQERIPLLRSVRRRLVDPFLKGYSILSTLLASTWWHLGMAGQLPEFLCPTQCIGQQDYVGLDYYWGISSLKLNRVQALIDAALGHFDRAPVHPGALRGLMHYLAELFPDLPLLIVENGSVVVADDVVRAAYLRRHVSQVQRVAADGVKVAGYVCWSITSNREWGHRFGPSNDFGLYHIDLDYDPELRRQETGEVEVYREIIGNRGVGSRGEAPPNGRASR